MLQDLQNKSYIKRVLWAVRIADNITKAHGDINQACQTLNVGFGTSELTLNRVNLS